LDIDVLTDAVLQKSYFYSSVNKTRILVHFFFFSVISTTLRIWLKTTQSLWRDCDPFQGLWCRATKTSWNKC